MNENEIPENLEFVERAAITTGSASAPVQQGVDRYQGAILSAPLGLDTDISRSQLPGANPVYRLMPASIAGNPASNASIQSTAAKTIAVTPSASVEGTESVTLNIPSIFTPVTQTQDLPDAILSFSLATELSHTFLGAPIPGLSGLTGVFGNSQSPTPSHATITFSAPSAGWALYMESLAGNSNTTPSGWVSWGDSAALSISSPSSITATDTVSSSLSWCNIAATFSGAIPTFIGNHQATYSLSSTSGTAALTFTPTAGNFLVVSIYGTASVGGSLSGFTLSNSRGDSFTRLASNSAGPSSFNGPVSLTVFIVSGAVGGSTTFNSTISGSFGGGTAFTLSVSEVTPFGAGAGIPLFRPIDATDLPSLSASNLSNGTTGTGTIVLAASPTLTGVLAAGSETLTGKITNYNSVATVSNGVPSEIVTVDLTAQGAAIAATNLIASAPASGMYRISWVAKVTQAAAAPATSVLGGTNGFQITYTDVDDSVVVTTPTWWEGGNNGAAPTSAAGNTTGTYIGGSLIVNAKVATAIKYAIDYTNGGATPMQFNLHIKLEAL